jgi:hypothetical protein
VNCAQTTPYVYNITSSTSPINQIDRLDKYYYISGQLQCQKVELIIGPEIDYVTNVFYINWQIVLSQLRY